MTTTPSVTGFSPQALLRRAWLRWGNVDATAGIRDRIGQIGRLAGLTRREVADFQLDRLRDVLRHCEAIPYYRRLLASCDLRPDAVTAFEDFTRIPPLTRSIVREQGHALESLAGSHSWRRRRTSGSTGRPVNFVEDADTASWSRAFYWYMLGVWGIDPLAPQLYVGNAVRTRVSRLVRRFVAPRTRFISTFELIPDRAPALFRASASLTPRVLSGFPSAVLQFGELLTQAGLPIHRLGIRLIVCGGETFYPFQREALRRMFDVPVVSVYGAREFGIMAAECLRGGLHVDAHDLFVEVEPSPALDEPGAGRVLITGFRNWAMPLVRYEIGDVGKSLPDCCPCGLPFPRLELTLARQVDMIVLPDGRQLHSIFLGQIFMDELASRGIDVTRFLAVQRTCHYFEIFLSLAGRAVPAEQLSSIIVESLSPKLGYQPNVSVRLVDDIPAEYSGKRKTFVCEVPEIPPVPSVAR